MAVEQIDPGTLEGDALRRWYLRSPAEIEQERQDAAAQRYQDFYGDSGGLDSDPTLDPGPDGADEGVDRSAGAEPAEDTGPAFTWVAAGPNRLRSVSVPAGPSQGIDRPDGSTAFVSGGLNDLTFDRAALGLASPSSDEQARGDGSAPAPYQPTARPASPLVHLAAHRRQPIDVGGRAQPRSPAATYANNGGQSQIAYGALRAPAPSDEDLAELRRKQAAFADTTRQIDIHNSWLAIPALAPVAVALGLEGAAAVAGRALAGESIEGPLNFIDREAWQRGAQKAAQALSDAEKTALRTAARGRYARANGISASEMQAEVHHSDPLEWAHLKPDADPNRLANLWGLRKEAHAIATREWGAFTRAREGRIPTQAELMEAKLRIDRLVEPYIRRAGLPRSNRLPGKGGPL